VVLPLYLRELNRVQVPPGAFARQLLLPLAATAVVGAVAWVAASAISPDVLALLVAGAAGLAAVGALVYRLRGTLRSLRAAQNS
jgi:hypothetical protein